MATRLVSGGFREVWREVVPLDGGSSQVITTNIACTAALLPKVDARLTLDAVTANPQISALTSVVNGKLTVTIANGAVAGNLATWTLDVTLNHSIQQLRGLGPSPTAAPISVLLGGNAVGGPPLLGEVAQVAKSGAQYTSVAAAVAAVTPLATVNTPWVVSVASGTYVEPPFTIPPYVTVQGLGFAVLVPANNAVDFISCTGSSFLNYVTIICPTGLGTAGVRRNSLSGSGDFVASNMLLIGGGRYGIRISQGGATINGVLFAGGTFDQFLRVDGTGHCEASSISYHSPTPGTTNYGFACVGAGAILRVFNSMFDCIGGSGVFVNDGAFCSLAGVQFVNGNIAVHMGSDGAPELLANAAVIQDDGIGTFTTNIRVDTAAAMIRFKGALSRNKFILAPGVQLDVFFMDLTPGDGGNTTIGEAYSARSGNPNLVFPETTYRNDTYLTGLRGAGDGGVTRAGGLLVDIAADYGYINDGVDKRQVTWNATQIALTANSTEYIYVDATGTVQHSSIQPVYASNIVLAQAVTNGTDVVLLTRDEITLAHTLSRTQEFFEDVIGPINLTGGAATINGGNPLGLDVDPGEFAVGLSERDIIGATGITFTYWYQSAPGVWVAVPGQTNIDTAQYNDITTGLVAMTGTNWKKDLLYVVVNAGGDEYHIVYGQEQFISQVAAEQGNYPAPPYILEHYAMRSGGVVSQRNALAIASVTDARPRLGGYISVAGVSAHGALTGLGADDHLQYLTTARADAWHLSVPVVNEAHVLNGNLHVHGIGGDGGQIDHVSLSNIGINTHAQIDAHIASAANPHATTYTQVGAPPDTRTLTAGAGLTGGGNLTADRTFDVVANVDGSIVVNANDIQVGVLATDAQHGNRGGGGIHALAIAGGAAGFMSGADKTKLDGLPASGLPPNYQHTEDATRTTTSSTAYPGAVKLTMTTPALTGTYRISWSATIDYSTVGRDMAIRLQNTTDAVTLKEYPFQPSNTVNRPTFSGQALVTFTGAAKTFQLQFRASNALDTAGCAYAYMDIWRVL